MSPIALYSALIAIGLTWACTIPLVKIAVSTGYQPMGLIFWQMLISSICLGAVNIVRRKPILLGRPFLLYYLVICLVGTLLPNTFSFVAAAQLPAGVMGIVIATVPMFSFGMAILIGNERFSGLRLMGILFGLSAMIMIAAPETSLPDPSKAVFVLVALMAPFFYGIEGNYIAWRNLKSVDPVTTLLGASIIGSVISAPLAWFSGAWINPIVPWEAPQWALLFSSLFHALAYSSFIWLVGKAGPVFSSQLGYVVTIGAVFLSAFFLGETYSGWVWAALAIMITGLILVHPKKNRSPAPKPGQG